MEPSGGGRNTAQNDRHTSNRSERYCKIKSKVDGFAEASQVLLQVLNEVKGIHPFIAAPVVAFKAVVTLELKRRENDDKVIFLLVKVQGLMEALVQLRAIPPGKRTEDHLCTVEGTLASLCVEIEEDIRECGNLCDTFSKKPFLVKLLKGPVYDIRLEEMAQKLDERQKELDHALHHFTALGIQSTNDAIHSAQDEISMLLLFQMLQSSVEKELLNIVNSKGGPRKCMEDENVLAELIQIHRSLTRESLGHSSDVVESSITYEPPPMQVPHESSGRPGISSPISVYRGMHDSRHPSRRPTVEIPITRDYHSNPPMSARQLFSNVGMHGSRRRARSFLVSEGYFSDPARTHQSPYYVSAPSESHSHYRHRDRYAYNSHRRKSPGTEVKKLMEELARDIDKEVERNRATFLRKFEEQQRQLLAIERAVVSQGDRVVQEVHRGPHDRIHDEELRSIWREMGWKLVVPTVEFVRTLHDYFVSQHKDMQILNDHFNHPPGPNSTPEEEMAALSKALTAAKQRSDEKWALKSLHFMNLQPISEAFDADCSGFVSVWEANQMISLRPNGWSLLQWLAYWASGRHYAITEYSNKINEILMSMHLLLRQKVLPVNRHTINRYLHHGMKTLDRVLATTIPCTNAPGGELARRVFRYTKNEEERMEHVLKALHYEIDGSDTVELITSRYQIERNFFPLVYLLLKRHLSLIRLACDVPLDAREMDTATHSLRTIFKAVKDRVLTLEAMSLDGWTFSPLRSFAFGMYYGVYTKLDAFLPWLNKDEEETVDAVKPAPISLLTHEPPTPCTSAPHHFYIPEDPMRIESCIGDYVNGFWSGHLGSNVDKSRDQLIQFRVSNWDGTKFEGNGSYHKGMISVEGFYDSESNDLRATIVGTVDVSTSTGSELDWKIFVLGSLDMMSFGHVGKRQYQISGTWSTLKEGVPDGYITLRQTPSWVYQFRRRYPGQTGRERWRFALQAVLHSVRSEHGILSKTFCVEKLREIRRATWLLKQRLWIGDGERQMTLRSRLSPSDSRLCHWLARFSLWPTFHFNAKCECGKPVMGNRLLQLRSDPTPHLEELCQHQAHTNLIAQQEACLKIVHFLHRRDQYPLLMKADSLFEFVYALSSRSSSPEDHRYVVSSSSQPVVPPHRQSSVGSEYESVFTRSMPMSMPGIRERVVNSTSVLYCVGCGANVPEENSDSLWVCLVCSVPESAEKLLILCSGCECVNRRCMEVSRFPTHSVHHSLLHVRSWWARTNVATRILDSPRY